MGSSKSKALTHYEYVGIVIPFHFEIECSLICQCPFINSHLREVKYRLIKVDPMNEKDRTLNAAQGFRLVCTVGDVSDIIIMPNTNFVFTRSNLHGGGISHDDAVKFSRKKHYSFVWMDASLCVIGKNPTHNVLY